MAQFSLSSSIMWLASTKVSSSAVWIVAWHLTMAYSQSFSASDVSLRNSFTKFAWCKSLLILTGEQ